MIINCCFMLMRLHNRTAAPLGVFSLHTGITRPARYKVIIKNQKAPGKKRKFIVWKGMMIKDLAKSMEMPGEDVMDALSRVVTDDSRLSYSMEIHDMKILSKVAKLCGGLIEEKRIAKPVEFIDRDVYCRNIFINSERLKPRPPVVTIMGHVDHGKTTLLDSLRSSRIVESEFGGITQHIGAFKVKLSDISSGSGSIKTANDIVTFLDTPGHAAFSSMRSRGAHCTDIVILVVAIDDGLMPQTLESIRFAKEAKVPIIVVINKVDRLCKNINEINSQSMKKRFDPIFQSLSTHGVVVEEYGGDVQCIPISALKKWNLDVLQESILALAEVIDIRCDYEGLCEGVVLEAKTIENLGKVTTVLIQQGSLKLGSIIVAGQCFAKVRTMKSDSGKMVKIAQPGDPIEITGWKEDLPFAGDVVIEVDGEHRAKEVLGVRKALVDKEKTEKDYSHYEKSMESYNASYKAYVSDGFKKGFRLSRERPELTDFLESATIVNGVEIPRVNLIIKTDVQGSLEAIEDVLELAVGSCAHQCSIKTAHIGVGNLSENDIDLAAHTNAIVYLFNLPQSLSASHSIKVDIRHFNVIYHLFDDLRDHVTSKLNKSSEREVIGEAVVLQMFDIREKKVKVPVIGSKCTSGTLFRNKELCFYRLMRASKDDGNDIEMIKDQLQCKSLRHLKSDVESVRRGVECGIVLLDKGGEPLTVSAGDVLQCCKTVYLEQKLNWNLGFQ